MRRGACTLPPLVPHRIGLALVAVRRRQCCACAIVAGVRSGDAGQGGSKDDQFKFGEAQVLIAVSHQCHPSVASQGYEHDGRVVAATMLVHMHMRVVRPQRRRAEGYGRTSSAWLRSNFCSPVARAWGSTPRKRIGATIFLRTGPMRSRRRPKQPRMRVVDSSIPVRLVGCEGLNF